MMMETLQDGGSDWVEAGPLPTPTYGLAVVTLGNRLLATGEQGKDMSYLLIYIICNVSYRKK